MRNAERWSTICTVWSQRLAERWVWAIKGTPNLFFNKVLLCELGPSLKWQVLFKPQPSSLVSFPLILQFCRCIYLQKTRPWSIQISHMAISLGVWSVAFRWMSSSIPFYVSGKLFKYRWNDDYKKLVIIQKLPIHTYIYMCRTQNLL